MSSYPPMRPVDYLRSAAFPTFFGGDASVDDEIFLIESHSVFKEVARDMGLERYHRVKDGMLASHVEYFKYPVDVIAPAGMADTLSTSIVFRVNVDKDGHVAVEAKAKRKTLAEIEGASFPVTVKTIYGTFVVDTTQYFVPGKKLRTDITYSSYDGAAEDMAEEVSASIASRKSNVIALGINTPIPDYGKALLNNIIAKYNERGVADKNIQGNRRCVSLIRVSGCLRWTLTLPRLSCRTTRRQRAYWMCRLRLPITWGEVDNGEGACRRADAA